MEGWCTGRRVQQVARERVLGLWVGGLQSAQSWQSGTRGEARCLHGVAGHEARRGVVCSFTLYLFIFFLCKFLFLILCRHLEKTVPFWRCLCRKTIFTRVAGVMSFRWLSDRGSDARLTVGSGAVLDYILQLQGTVREPPPP